MVPYLLSATTVSGFVSVLAVWSSIRDAILCASLTEPVVTSTAVITSWRLSTALKGFILKFRLTSLMTDNGGIRVGKRDVGGVYSILVFLFQSFFKFLIGFIEIFVQ